MSGFDNSISQNPTTSLPEKHAAIKPIIFIYSVKLTSKSQLKALQKKRRKIRKLDISEAEMFYSYTIVNVFTRPSTAFLRSLKTLMALRTTSYSWMTVQKVFSSALNIISRLRKFTVGIQPRYSKLKVLAKFINTMKNLNSFEDSNRAIANKDSYLLNIWPCLGVKRYNYSPNVNVSAFPRIKHLSISVPVLNLIGLKFQNSLREISLIDHESQGQTDFGHKFYLIMKELIKYSNLTNLNLVFPFKVYYQRAFKDLKNDNLTVNLVTDIDSLLDSKTTLSDIKTFIRRTHSKVILGPRNCSNEKYLALLYLLEEKYIEYNESFFVNALSFNFHSPFEVQNRVSLYFHKMSTTIEKITFNCSMNSLDWFTAWRIENWRTMIDNIFKNPGRLEKLTVAYNIAFTDNLYKDTFYKIIEEAVYPLKRIASQGESNDMVHLEINVLVEHLKSSDELNMFLERCVRDFEGEKTVKVMLDKYYSANNDEEVSKALRNLKNRGVINGFIIK